MRIKLTINKQYTIFLIFFYFFLVKDFLEDYIGFLGYADELVAVYAIPLYFINFRKNRLKAGRKTYSNWVFIFMIVGLCSTLMHMHQPFLNAALPDMLLCAKFWLAMYVGRNVFEGFSVERYAKKIYFHIRLVVWIYIVLMIADSISVALLDTEIFDAEIRYGLRATQLFYEHPTIFVAVCTFLAAVCISIRNYVKGSGTYIIWIGLLMCTSLRSKSFAAALAFLFIYYLVYLRKKKIRLRTLLALIPLVVLVSWTQIEFYFFDATQSHNARNQLLQTSIRIAKDYFPFGSGFATFASHFSTVSYSELYITYGLSMTYGLKRGAALFASDTFWPMILAQTGWIGLISYAIAVLALIIHLQKLRKINLAYYVSGMFILVYLLISSTAESAFVSNFVVPLAVWLGFVLSNTNKGENK